MQNLSRAVAALCLSLALAPDPGSAQAPSPSPAGRFSPEERQEIIGILREALRQDPAILREALEAMESAEQENRDQAARAAIAAEAEALFRNPEDPVRGNPQGRVTLVEFIDTRCGYCKQLHPTLTQLIRRNPDLRVVMKDLPILGPNSVLAARALLAAQRQDKYGPLQDALLALREEPTEPVIRREAERLGLDWARLRRDMDDPSVQRRLEANLRLAQALRIQGTPAIVVGEQLVPGAVDLGTLEALVAAARPVR